MAEININIARPNRAKETVQSLYIRFRFSLETLAKVKALPERHYIASTKEWEVPIEHLQEVLNVLGDKKISIKSPQATFKSVTAVSNIESVRSVSTAFEYKTEPFEHQREGFEYGLKVDQFILGDEQGLGKTKQAIDIAVNKKLTHGFKHTLIICGVNSLKHNWMNEVAVHSNEQARVLGSKIITRGKNKGKTKDGTVEERLEELNSDLKEYFLITNVESLRNKQLAEKIKELTSKGIIGMTIIDEIHKCKNPQSQQGKAIHFANSKFKMALTGTPLMNKAEDLFNVLKWIGKEKSSFYAFRNRYCVMGGYGGYEVVGYKNLPDLQKKLASAMLRRKKDEVLNLPPKIRSTEIVEMTAKQSQLYREVLAGIKSNIQEIALSPNPLSQLIRLRQVTAHTSILSQTISESAKIDRLKEMIEELVSSGKKAIVFSNWTSVTDIVKAELKEYNPAVITGEVKNRQEEVDRFQNDDNCKVIIGTISAMGTGLTLTKASTVIFMDKPWNMANTEQAEDRAHRIGTTGTVNIVTLVCKDTIDERIEDIIEEKAEMAKGLVEGDEEAILKMMSTEELVNRLLS